MVGKAIEYQAKKRIKKIIKKGLLIIIRYLGVPILVFLIIIMLVSYITDIFYLGIKNEEKSNT